MPKCSFCSRVYEIPHGLTLVLNDGTVLYFCSSKCRKSWQMGRKSKKLRWIKKAKQNNVEKIQKTKEEKGVKEEKSVAKEEKK